MEREMDWNRVEGNWKQVKGKVKAKWGELTDDDLTLINGRRDHLLRERIAAWPWGKTASQGRLMFRAVCLDFSIPIRISEQTCWVTSAGLPLCHYFKRSRPMKKQKSSSVAVQPSVNLPKSGHAKFVYT